MAEQLVTLTLQENLVAFLRPQVTASSISLAEAVRRSIATNEVLSRYKVNGELVVQDPAAHKKTILLPE